MLGRRSLVRAAGELWRSGMSSSGGGGNPVGRRYFAEEAKKESQPIAAFRELWKKVSNADPPQSALSLMGERPAVPATIPEKLTVNFVLPYEIELNAEKVDMVIIPATTGLMGVLPGHVPTIAELKPGVLSVHEGGQVKSQYFLSGGFAFIHANSITDIVAVDAAPLDRFDPDEVKKNLTEYNQKFSSANTDLDKAQAQIGVEVFSSLAFALGVQA